MAAGRGSRFGGMKQVAGLGPAEESLFDFAVRSGPDGTIPRYRPDPYVGGDWGTPAHPLGANVPGDECAAPIPGGRPTGRWVYRSRFRYLGDYWNQPLAPFATYGGAQIALPLTPANTPQIKRTFILTGTPGNPNINIHGYDIGGPEAPA